MDGPGLTGGTADAERLSAVVGDVYDAAMDPELWSEALRSACALAGLSAGFLFFQDLAGAERDHCYAWGDDPEQRNARFRSYVRHNPAFSGSAPTKVGEVHVGSASAGPGDLLASPLGAEWLAPQDFCDFASVVLERSNLNLTCLAFAAEVGAGCIDAEAERAIALVAPHFRRAAAVGEALGLRRVETAAFAETLDRLSAAVFLVDAGGQVVHSNRSGRRMLAEAQVLHSRRDVLSAVDRTADRALRLALAAAAGQAHAPSDPEPIALPGPDETRRLAYVLPLDAGLRREAGRRFAATAAVFVHRTSIDARASLRTLARLYSLTKGELRVLDAALEPGGTREMAEALQLSEHTVNTHLKHLFEKTGLRRKDELIKLVAAHAGPLEV